ncbi:hypothetical protein QVD17_04842 [Tagetes erecta]|uniref:Uncharacterized protein n=1 Tax=Tagetes erecta TaxID=13708 RepID=A0AAD8LCP3_TARER|nr:hypothetical protein QVD17_04842 [Tagetes erecta]
MLIKNMNKYVQWRSSTCNIGRLLNHHQPSHPKERILFYLYHYPLEALAISVPHTKRSLHKLVTMVKVPAYRKTIKTVEGLKLAADTKSPRTVNVLTRVLQRPTVHLSEMSTLLIHLVVKCKIFSSKFPFMLDSNLNFYPQNIFKTY